MEPKWETEKKETENGNSKWGKDENELIQIGKAELGTKFGETKMEKLKMEIKCENQKGGPKLENPKYGHKIG